MNLESTDISGLMSMIKRQIRLMALSGAIIIGLVLVYLFNTTPLYTSSALIYVDPSKKDLLATEQFGSLSGLAENSKIESEVEILRSNRVLFETMTQLRLVQDTEFGPRLSRFDQIKTALGLTTSSQGDPTKMVAATAVKLSDALRIQRKGLTYLISVSATSSSPQKAATIANTLSEVYIAQQVAAKTDAALSARDVLQAQINTAKTQLARSESGFDRFMSDNSARLKAEVGTDVFLELERQVTAARESTRQIKAQIETAQTARASKDWDALVTALSNDALAGLNAQRRQIELRLTGTQESAQTQESLRAALSQTQSQMDQQADDAISSFQTTLTVRQNSLAEAQRAMRQEMMQGDLSPETLASLFEIQQEADIAQRQYTTLLSSLRSIEAQALVQVADSRVVSDAIASSFPSAPNYKISLAIALIVASGVAFGLAIINEYFVGGVSALSQLRNLVSGPVIGLIPNVTITDTQLSIADLVTDAPMSLFSEALRRARAHIDQGLRDHPSRCVVMMVTSANIGEGKSSVSLALARTYANAGKNVLLIDADLRRPSQHKYIGFEPDEGFLEYLRDSRDKKEVGRSFYVADPKSQAAIILGRGNADLPTDQLLQTTAFCDLIESARQSVDIVIIDTPPVLPVVDARYIAPLVDAIVFTVRYGTTAQGDVRDATAQLEAAKKSDTPIFATLNADETQSMRGGYYYAEVE
ncbi:GumC family protein [Celeribacter marinus]|nr:Wzz/FepE/Etk N-terminal domain-containing protein [Celeribacter marinus]